MIWTISKYSKCIENDSKGWSHWNDGLTVSLITLNQKESLGTGPRLRVFANRMMLVSLLFGGRTFQLLVNN